MHNGVPPIDSSHTSSWSVKCIRGFGRSVSLSDDGNTFAAGAAFDTMNNPISGTIYITFHGTVVVHVGSPYGEK